MSRMWSTATRKDGPSDRAGCGRPAQGRPVAAVTGLATSGHAGPASVSLRTDTDCSGGSRRVAVGKMRHRRNPGPGQRELRDLALFGGVTADLPLGPGTNHFCYS